MSPTDPGIEARTGFASVKSFDSDFRIAVEISRRRSEFLHNCSLSKGTWRLSARKGGWSNGCNWLRRRPSERHSRANRRPAPNQVARRIAFLKEAIGLTLDSHLSHEVDAPGSTNIKWPQNGRSPCLGRIGGGGLCSDCRCRPEFHSVHYDKLSRKIEDGDIVVLDVAAQYAGYSADITRTIPANGKYTARQREIYDIVLGRKTPRLRAQAGWTSVAKVTRTSTRLLTATSLPWKGSSRKALGIYFIHGLGHHIA